MNYCMRFIQTGGEALTLANLDLALREEDAAYSLDDGGLLCLGELQCAQVAILHNGEDGFDKLVRILISDVEKAEGRHRNRVLSALQGACSIINLEVIWQDRVPEQTLQMIDPLWSWLFSNRPGLVQADQEGYYERSRRILAVD